MLFEQQLYRRWCWPALVLRLLARVMTSLQMRQRIQLEFRRQQLVLDKEALALLVEHVEQAATGLDAVYSIVEKLEAGIT